MPRNSLVSSSSVSMNQCPMPTLSPALSTLQPLQYPQHPQHPHHQQYLQHLQQPLTNAPMLPHITSPEPPDVPHKLPPTSTQTADGATSVDIRYKSPPMYTQPVDGATSLDVSHKSPPTFAQPAVDAPHMAISATISAILAIPSIDPGPSQFLFQLDHLCAIHNVNILEAHNFNLNRTILADGNSSLHFGSELCPPEALQLLLGPHPLWPRIEALLRHGPHFSADNYPKDQCLEKVDAALAYGNHKGAIKQPDTLFDLLDDDVTHGFSLPPPWPSHGASQASSSPR
jgi:hypothetical protein